MTGRSFSTVGFGDITATSQVARVIVIVQMLLDLIVIGVVIRVFLGAVQRGRWRRVPPGSTVLLCSRTSSTPCLLVS